MNALGRLRAEGRMRTFSEEEELDAVVIGTGAGGAPILAELAAAGLRVAALEAGPWWDAPAEQLASERRGVGHVAEANLGPGEIALRRPFVGGSEDAGARASQADDVMTAPDQLAHRALADVAGGADDEDP